jgi:hypothetical protein
VPKYICLSGKHGTAKGELKAGDIVELDSMPAAIADCFRLYEEPKPVEVKPKVEPPKATPKTPALGKVGTSGSNH